MIRRSAQRGLRAALGIGAALSLGAAASIFTADALLTLRSSLKPSDVIVVLGGDGPRRAARTAALYREGIAPRVLVTGDGDCLYIRDAVVARGVPAEAVEVECLSRDTRENARFSAPILERMGARRIVLVTSWFHMRRAAAAFNKADPDLRLLAAPVEPDPDPFRRLADPDIPRVALEYVKLGWYALRFGILPFPRLDAALAAAEVRA